MSDLEAAVEAFLAEADDVYGEYERGYMDADAALARLEGPIDDLEAALED